MRVKWPLLSGFFWRQGQLTLILLSFCDSWGKRKSRFLDFAKTLNMYLFIQSNKVAQKAYTSIREGKRSDEVNKSLIAMACEDVLH